MRLADVLRPFLVRAYLERVSDASFLLRHWRRRIEGGAELMDRGPLDLRTALAKLARGELELRLQMASLAGAERERARSANRLALAALVGAGIVSAALLLGVETGTTIAGVEANALFATGAAALSAFGLGLLAFGFLRSGRF